MQPTVCLSVAKMLSEQCRVSAIQIRLPASELTKMFPFSSSSASLL